MQFQEFDQIGNFVTYKVAFSVLYRCLGPPGEIHLRLSPPRHGNRAGIMAHLSLGPKISKNVKTEKCKKTRVKTKKQEKRTRKKHVKRKYYGIKHSLQPARNAWGVFIC